jgi:putative ATPase
MEQLNVFQKQAREEMKAEAPLAEKLRPRTLEEFVGQSHLLEPGKTVERVIRHRRPQSLILWGPPGCGKTTLARIVAGDTGANLVSISAVTAGTKEIRSAVEAARQSWIRERRRTWLFIDEIHRLNKAQQDVLLPHVEEGTLYLLGATTENPSFEVIRPLLSRSQVLVLEPLSDDELRTIIRRALTDEERGLGHYPAELTPEAETYLLAASGGDARVVLNGLELAVLTTPPDEDGVRRVDETGLRDAMQRRAVHYDKTGDEHYNLISALHKSLRGSDPDASLYWLARMLDGGEDPLYLARRLIRAAAEDVGLADPQAVSVALDAFQSYQIVGSPEGELFLAMAAVYIAQAPKSNSVYKAFGKARETAAKSGGEPVPMHLRNAPTALMKRLGYAQDYKYPHHEPGGWVAELYLPEKLAGTEFYHPVSRGWEGRWLRQLQKRREQVKREHPAFREPNESREKPKKGE